MIKHSIHVYYCIHIISITGTVQYRAINICTCGVIRSIMDFKILKVKKKRIAYDIFAF